jgi:putative hydrolase of the HAD superfamily
LEQTGKFNKIRAVSFDVDETLWDFQTTMRRSLGRVLQELERIDPDAAAMLDIERMVEIRNRVGRELKGKVIDLEAIRHEAFRETLREAGKPDEALASHLNQLYLKYRFKDVKLFDDVLPTLNALRPNYTLGVISNGNTYPKYCGLEDVLQFAVFAQDCGVEKPDAGIFEIALEKAGCSADELLHVGDSIDDDIEGALGAGIRVIWLNRTNAEKSAEHKELPEISSLLELLEILALQ